MYLILTKMSRCKLVIMLFLHHIVFSVELLKLQVEQQVAPQVRTELYSQLIRNDYTE